MPFIDIIKALLFERVDPSDRSLYDNQSFLLKVSSRLWVLFSSYIFYFNILTTTAISGKDFSSSTKKAYGTIVLNTSKYLVLTLVSLFI